jgi:hypothetical protein
MLLQIHTGSDAELELWAASHHSKPFEELVRKPVRLEVSRPAAPARSAAKRARRVVTRI